MSRIRALSAIAAAFWIGLGAPAAPAQEPPAAAPPSVDDLAFFAGCWEGDLGEGLTIRETYTAPRAGAILGNSQVVRGGETVFFEFSRIADDGSGVAFRPYPNGETTVSFTLTRSGPGEAVFENPDHDHPQRIVYRREDDRLTAEVGNLDGSRTERFPMRAVPCCG